MDVPSGQNFLVSQLRTFPEALTFGIAKLCNAKPSNDLARLSAT